MNWLESVGLTNYAFIQFVIVRLSLFIILIRKKRIVWMLHNKHPHGGVNWMTNNIQDYLYKRSKIIISHSFEVLEFARIKAGRNVKVLYRCHPVCDFTVRPKTDIDFIPDLFIWGEISPYKGVIEFLNALKLQKTHLKCLIVGNCKNLVLKKRISDCCSDNILFINRRADIEEIAHFCKISKFVLFPYVGGSVSSSGALIETIVLGGVPIGPFKGAFRDLEKEGVCYTYKDYNHLFSLLSSNLSISDCKRQSFIDSNSWENFALYFYQNVGK